MLSAKPTMVDEQTVSRVFNGVTLTGTYTLQDDILTLRTAFGNKTAQLLGSNIPGAVPAPNLSRMSGCPSRAGPAVALQMHDRCDLICPQSAEGALRFITSAMARAYLGFGGILVA